MAPRTPLLQYSRRATNNGMSISCSCEVVKGRRSEVEVGEQHERKTREVMIMDVARKKRKMIIESEYLEQQEEMLAMKRGGQRNENLRHEKELRVKTELSGGETTQIESTNTAVNDKGDDTPLCLTPNEELVNDDILSMLSGPPQAPDTSGIAPEMLQAYALIVPAVKSALVSFLTSAKPEDAALMITQANCAFTSLRALCAEYSSFYDAVVSYILKCSTFSNAEKDLQDNMEAMKLVSCHAEELANQSTKSARALSDTETHLVKAKQFLPSLETKLNETKSLLEMLETEREEAREVVAGWEAVKIERMEAFAEINAKLRAIAPQAKKAKRTIINILYRQEKARARIEKIKARSYYLAKPDTDFSSSGSF